MSERNEFDDLARRKLEERETAFHEADWLEAQRLIEAQRQGGVWRTWLLVGVSAVVLGTAVWWMMEGKEVAPAQFVQENVVNSAEEARVEEPIAASSATTTTSEHPTSPVSTNTTAADLLHPVGLASAPSNVTVPAAPTAPKPTATITSSEATRPIPTGAMETSTQRSRTGTVPSTPIIASATTMPEPKIETHQQPMVAPVPASDPPSVVEPTAKVDAQDPSDIGEPIVAASEEPTGNEELMPEPESMTGRSSSVVEQTTTGTGEETEASTAGPNVIPENAASTDPPLLLLASPATIDSSASEDQGVAANNEPVIPTTQDSATAVIPPPPPPLITPTSPWEIGVLLGGLRSASSFTGGNSDEWNSGMRGQWTPAFGAEVMHMGRNFGVGSGIHYSTFQEELNIEERSLTTTTISDSNYFEPFHTTVLYVLGNVEINGQTFYVTESRDTTINILVLGTSTSTSTRKLNDALHVVNRVSYLEIPLLMDAHLVQGPWALGLRGGPTIGVLSGRSGVIPNSTFDGYTPYSDQQFRTTVFGLTARAYLRYRFTNGWSIGLEPTWRGQFGNALSGDLVRRNSAMGGMLSVSYRLR